MDQIKDLLHRLPIFLFLGVYLVTIACDMKTFLEETNESPLFQKKQEVSTMESELTALKRKEKQAAVFFKEYQARREALLQRANELRNMKNTLSDNIRQEEVLSIISKVARRSGVKQVSLRPRSEKKSQFYFERPFEFQFEGFYEQLMVFLTMLAREEKIFKVDNYDIRPQGGKSQLNKFIRLGGKMEIKVYWYNSSKADQITGDI